MRSMDPSRAKRRNNLGRMAFDGGTGSRSPLQNMGRHGRISFSLRIREDARLRKYIGSLTHSEDESLSTELINQATIMKWSHHDMQQNLRDTKNDEKKLASDKEDMSQKLFAPKDFHQTRLRKEEATIHQRSLKFGLSSHKTRYDKMEPEKTKAMKNLQKVGDSFRLHRKKVKTPPALNIRAGHLLRAAEIEVSDMARLTLVELFRTLARPKYKKVRENHHIAEFVSQMVKLEAVRSHLYNLQWKLERASESEEVVKIFCTLKREYLSENAIEHLDESTVEVKRFNKRTRENFREECEEVEEHIKKKHKTTHRSSPRKG